MYISIPMVIGGTIPLTLIALLIGRLALKNIEMRRKIILSTLTAAIIVTILSGFGNANGGNFAPMYLVYALSAIIVLSVRLTFYSVRRRSVEKKVNPND